VTSRLGTGNSLTLVSILTRGQIPKRNYDKILKSCPPCYSQSPLLTATYVMLLMRADTLQGQVGGGWALEIETFLDPVKWV
jgi:hypothetical protein